MDKYVKSGIDARKQAIINAYELDNKMRERVDTLFAEIEKLGSSCKDVQEFEAKFAESPLNQQYLDLFTEVATSSQPVGADASSKGAGKTIAGVVAGGIVSGVADRALNEAKQAVLPTRAAVNQKVTDKMRGMPVVGDAMTVKQHLDFFGRFKKKKDE